MPTIAQIELNSLKLDLNNFRTVQQKNEKDAIKAMISIKADRFFAVIESIIDDGYLPTENIIVLKSESQNIVKEGNRRIAALKIIHGTYKTSDFNLPSHIIEKIKSISNSWRKENLKVPCTIYNEGEIDKADRVIALAHGKGEKASRDPWNSVARARHNRDVNNGLEPGLDLLEKYLKKGSNLNSQQKDRWGGEYNLSVLDEALRKIHPRLGFINSLELAKKYPNIKKLTEFENILRDIGLEQIGFAIIRNTHDDFPTKYGILPIDQSNTADDTSKKQHTSNPDTSKPTSNTTNSSKNTDSSDSTSTNDNNNSSKNKSNAYATNDPKYISSLLKKFNPKGNNRQKVTTLRDEMKKLKLTENPIAFCFLLRSMFEISAKAYCSDHNIQMTKNGGKDKTLVELLNSITSHLTNNNSNVGMTKTLHGAITEISKKEGILSVTSMNQLVHNPSFSIVASDITTLFGNIYPLLESMN